MLRGSNSRQVLILRQTKGLVKRSEALQHPKMRVKGKAQASNSCLPAFWTERMMVNGLYRASNTVVCRCPGLDT
jgi:hypothetical protein